MVDYERVCKIVITELRSGKLGPITLETPGLIETELAELKIELAAKAEKKRGSRSQAKGQVQGTEQANTLKTANHARRF